MKVLITGICGFAGSTLARGMLESGRFASVAGFDNLSRAGSETNLEPLRALGIDVRIGDVRQAEFVSGLEAVDWVIDAAAQPSVLAGIDGRTGSRELIEHNLYGTVNLLEYCKVHRAGFILLSTSRVYSIGVLSRLAVEPSGPAFHPREPFPAGVGEGGITEDCSTAAPVSLYGSSKVASEQLALEYGEVFDFPVWINRCGVLAGAGQFGHPEQGIFSFWIHAWRSGRPLSYIGFDGMGRQVRDALHPLDLMPVLEGQMAAGRREGRRIYNLGGGPSNCMSLAELSAWCGARYVPRPVGTERRDRPFDLPWIVMDSRRAETDWSFQPQRQLPGILEEIADFADAHPEWLEMSMRSGSGSSG